MDWTRAELRRQLSAGAAVLVLSSPIAPAAVIDLHNADGFSAPDWSVSVSPAGNWTAAAFSQGADVGNPSPSLTFSGQVAAGSYNFASISGLLATYTYNPQIEGPLSSIDFSIDTIDRLALNTAPVPRVNFCIYQMWQGIPGVAFCNPNAAVTSSWTAFSQPGLTTADFAYPPGGPQPDFSGSGPPIHFGFALTSGRLQNAPAFPFDLAIDNWSVTLHTVPIPAVGWLLGPAFGLLGYRKRRMLSN